MPLQQRTNAIQAFQTNPACTVFLLSPRSAAAGISLTAANHVFLVEPSLNPASAAQAVGRTWRQGQQRPVTVKQLYVAGSVEEALVALATRRGQAAGAGEGVVSMGGEGGVPPQATLRRRRNRFESPCLTRPLPHHMPPTPSLLSGHPT